MSNPAPAFAAELDAESAATRRLLERVPADKLSWKPHPKSMSLGQLAFHVARIPGQMAQMARKDGQDVSGAGEAPSPASASEILPTLEAGLADAKAFLAGLDESAARTTWRLTAGNREIFAIPRIGMIRSMMLNHWYHHRGQLTVYLRMLDVPLPIVYGRSADENGFARA
ncbi:MAG TPA: DinB family protein [Thermoanaerobaculia bacterium]|nr:DinB family protein [Thermoanaerobaculia bacterium]